MENKLVNKHKDYLAHEMTSPFCTLASPLRLRFTTARQAGGGKGQLALSASIKWEKKITPPSPIQKGGQRASKKPWGKVGY